MAKNLITLKEAAGVLHLHPVTLRRMCAERRIKHIRPNGRRIFFDVDELNDYIEDRTFTPIN